MYLPTREWSPRKECIRVYQVIAFFAKGGCLPVGKLYHSQHAAKVEATKWIGVDYYGSKDPFVKTVIRKCYMTSR